MIKRCIDRIPLVNGFRVSVRTCVLVAVLLSSGSVLGDDEASLRGLLGEFLSRVDETAMHDRFWDDALIYTSSSGARFGKADILEGMTQGADDEEAAAVRYWAEDVRVMLFGETAVVAFRLMSESGEGEAAEQASYFNTGTFRRGADGWRVVAWQATRIPDGD
jgi:hypothetical protein